MKKISCKKKKSQISKKILLLNEKKVIKIKEISDLQKIEKKIVKNQGNLRSLENLRSKKKYV